MSYCCLHLALYTIFRNDYAIYYFSLIQNSKLSYKFESHRTNSDPKCGLPQNFRKFKESKAITRVIKRKEAKSSLVKGTRFIQSAEK